MDLDMLTSIQLCVDSDAIGGVRSGRFLVALTRKEGVRNEGQILLRLFCGVVRKGRVAMRP